MRGFHCGAMTNVIRRRIDISIPRASMNAERIVNARERFALNAGNQKCCALRCGCRGKAGDGVRPGLTDFRSYAYANLSH